MLNTIIAPWPTHTDEEIEAVTRVLKSGKTNQWTGSEVVSFEKEFAEYIGTEYAIAMSNGTTALDVIMDHVSRYYCQVGSEVILTSRTFIATASSVMNANLIPIFADVDRDSQNITADTIRSVITKDTIAIICVHLAGMPCDMDAILDLAKEHNLIVIEDCAQAHGAEYKGKKIGSIGHAAAWSFCQDKIMTTGGEGGMITTNAEDLFKYCWSKKDHGKSYDKVFNTIHPPGFRWLHDSFGSNYRMTEMQAAIGRIQLRNLDQSVKRRNILANSYDRVANKYSCIRRIDIDKEIYTHAKYKHYLMVNPGGLDEGWSRDKIIEELLNIDFPCTTGSCSEIYLEDAFYPYRACISNKRMKVAKELGDNSIMLLVHPTITPVDQVMLSIKLRRILEMASKEKYD